MGNKIDERFFERVSLKFEPKTVQPLKVEGKVLEEYVVEYYGLKSKIKVVEASDGGGYYIVEEDMISPEEVKAFSVLAGLMTAEEVAGISDRIGYIDRMKKVVREKSSLIGSNLSEEQVDRVIRYVAREVLGYGVLDPLMNDENVSDIVCPSYVRGVVVKHRNYPDLGWLNTNIRMSQSELDVFVQKLAGKFGRELSVMMPKVEVMSEDGSRFMMTFRSEISLPSSTFAIRKFPKKSWSIARLVELKMLTPEIAAYLWYLVEKKRFIIISGPMGSGKTTLLTALLSLINPVNMVCTCEDVPEIILPPQIKWYRLVSRKGSVFGVRESEVSLFDTVLLSLRTGADYVIVGEVRGVEIQALVQAAGAGMGCMTTFHADSMGSLVARMKGKPLSVDESFLMTIGSVVFVGNLPVGVERNLRRRVVSVEEPSYSKGEFTSDKIFSFNPKDDVFEPADLEEVF
ncbi:MAG: type II/IV secretion system ATPase subunit, partial [Candidatus Bathyarchaeia archaeon]